MKLVEEQPNSYPPKDLSNKQKQKQQEQSFLKPFKKFQSSITLSIKIHFLRFLFVTVIYFYSDIFLTNQKNSSQPWNSLLYFLAIMIEIIKFIGDCSLRNLLRNQEKKLCQIHETKIKTQSGNQTIQNITLKGAKYEDYMYIFSIIQIFKFQHKNYSSAFSISKYMHLICTFLVFGWMSLAQQYKEETNWIQLVVLETFLYSIYFTSFQIDFFLIETSEGKFSNQDKYDVMKIQANECEMVKKNFTKWRKSYILIQSVGTIFVLVGIFINFKFSLLFCTAIVVSFTNAVGLKIQKMIGQTCQNAIGQMRRDQINTYSLLKKSTSSFESLFGFFIIFQRLSYVFLAFSFARDQSLSLINFCILGLGIFLLILSQIKKFEDGNSLKLMSIIQDSFSSSMISDTETETNLECAICLKVFQKGESVCLLPCSKGHIFHTLCFQDWKKIKTLCPLCRYPLSEYL